MMKPRHDRSRTLHCEVLEPRQMLAVSATLSGSVLNVVGSEGDDDIRFFQSGKNIFIQGVEGYWSSSRTKTINVDSKSGNDYVSLNSFSNGGNKSIKENVYVYGGDGSERLNVGDIHDVVFSGLGNYAQVDSQNSVKLNGVSHIPLIAVG